MIKFIKRHALKQVYLIVLKQKMAFVNNQMENVKKLMIVKMLKRINGVIAHILIIVSQTMSQRNVNQELIANIMFLVTVFWFLQIWLVQVTLFAKKEKENNVKIGIYKLKL